MDWHREIDKPEIMTQQQIDAHIEGLRMNNEELLTAISDIIDQKPVGFQLDMKVSEKNINRNIH